MSHLRDSIFLHLRKTIAKIPSQICIEDQEPTSLRPCTVVQAHSTTLTLDGMGLEHHVLRVHRRPAVDWKSIRD